MAATSTIAVVQGGIVRIPRELEADPGFRDGARVMLLSLAASALSDETDPETDWRALEGMFGDSSFDATDWKRQEREFELAHDERKSGINRPEW
jgi:hypothetical protein